MWERDKNPTLTLWAYSSVGLERTPDKREVGGSSPPRPTKIRGGIAQLGEHLPCKQGVSGSSPLTSTKLTLELSVL